MVRIFPLSCTSQIILKEGARISSFSQGPGQSGSISISAADNLTIFGTTPENFDDDSFDKIPHSEPEAGNSGLSGLLSHSTSIAPNAGNAGSILIQAVTLHLVDGGIITASATNAGGGNIVITSFTLFTRK